MTAMPDQIASLVQKQFDALPAKRKPVIRGNGVHEWVPLSGIVAEGKDGKLHCLALATGMKCLPAAKLPQAQGNMLHDWHAEVLAIRAFNCFVLDECKALAQGGPAATSEFLRLRTQEEIDADNANSEENEGGWHRQPFTWRADVRLHMYCSEAPCGDASMELTISSQSDATPWAIPASALPLPLTTSPVPVAAATTNPAPSPSPSPSLPGRAYFSALGIPRRKPSRADAPPTLSKSCSDKLSRHTSTSLLSSITALLASPQHAYLSTLVVPSSQHHTTGYARAFSAHGGRLAPVARRSRVWAGGYAFRGFEVRTFDEEEEEEDGGGGETGLAFAFSKRAAGAAAAVGTTTTTTGDEKKQKKRGGKKKKKKTVVPSNQAVAWTRSGREETTLGGVLQGRRQCDARGASFASRRAMWALAREVAGALVGGDGGGGGGLAVEEVRRALDAATYGEVKGSGLLEARRRVKEEVTAEALKGWVKNSGDEAFAL
ncbi:adenosine deaminase/editase [Xylariaceae sp. FL0662B]|nr:adenosine deaminase/editase [Xylariaceae sp. FL0662B]